MEAQPEAFVDADVSPPNEEEDELAGLGLGPSDDEAAVEAGAELEPNVEPEDAADEEAQVEGQEEEEEDDNASVQADEAEEEEAPAKKRKRTDAQERQALREEVKALIAGMESAIAKDAADVAVSRPATRKLTMLGLIDEAVSKVKVHDILLDEGFVGCLKGFLEPMDTDKVGPTGQPVPTLPHAKVRGTVYRALQRLPINTVDTTSRSMLKQSGIGPVLRFYKELRDENAANRQLVDDLLKAWMGPIVEEGRKAVLDTRMDDERRQGEMRELKRRRKVEKEMDERDAKRVEVQQAGKRVGDAGYRYHARVPRASRPEYVTAPQMPAQAGHAMDGEKRVADKGNRARIKKATLELQRQRKGGDVRSTKVELSTKRVGNDLM